MNKKIILSTMCILLLTVSTLSTIGVNTNIEKTETPEKIEAENYLISTEMQQDIEYMVQELSKSKDINISEYPYILITTGPVGPIKGLISKVKIDTDCLQAKLINVLMKRTLLRFIAPKLSIVPFINQGLNLTVKYRIPLRLKSSFRYSTTYGEHGLGNNQSLDKIINNYSNITENFTVIYNKAHTLEIEDLHGIFYFKKSGFGKEKIQIREKLIDLPSFKPSHFIFIGLCKDITRI